MNIGEKIKKYRELNKFTQKELSEKIGVTAVTIARYEQNQRKPNIDALTKIAKAFGISVNDLITYEERRNEEYLNDINILIERFPEYKEKILDIFGFVYDSIESEFYKPSRLKTNDTIMQTLDLNIDLYYELFKTIFELSNGNPYISDCIKNDKLVKLYRSKDKKLALINEIINKIFNNYLVRYGVTDVKPQGIIEK